MQFKKGIQSTVMSYLKVLVSVLFFYLAFVATETKLWPVQVGTEKKRHIWKK